MADIFSEVDEDLRRDRYQALWKRFGKYVIGLAVLIVLMTAGYRGWQAWQENQSAAAGDAYISAVELAETGDHSQALTALTDLSVDSYAGYPVLARFRAATEKHLSGDVDGAIAAFDVLAADPDISEDMRSVARLRAGAIAVDTGSLDDVKSRLGALAEGTTGWRHMAREFVGLAAWKGGDMNEARRWYEMIGKDLEAPRDIRGRADIAIAVINGAIGAGAEPAKDAAGSEGATQ